MSVGPPNVSFVPSERLMIFAPFWAAHRIAWDVLSEDPWPFDPSDRRAITLTCATPAMSTLLSVIAAITPATPVPWYKPDGSLSIGFRSPSMKSYPWLVPSDGFTHMFACKSSWVHQTPVSTTATTTEREPSVTSHAESAPILQTPHWPKQLKYGSFGLNSV